MHVPLSRQALVRLAVSIAAAATSATAHADPPALSWQCTLESGRQVSLYCVPAPSSSADRPVAGGTDWQAQPIPPGSAGDMRPVADRGSAEVYSADAWRIPLHARPTNALLLDELMRSVLCGTHPACQVRLDGPGSRLAGR